MFQNPLRACLRVFSANLPLMAIVGEVILTCKAGRVSKADFPGCLFLLSQFKIRLPFTLKYLKTTSPCLD